MFDPCPSERMVKFRVHEDTTQGSTWVKWSGFAGRNRPPTPNSAVGAGSSSNPPCGNPPSTAGIARPQLDQDHRKALGHKARSHHVRNESGRYGEGATEEMKALSDLIYNFH